MRKLILPAALMLLTVAAFILPNCGDDTIDDALDLVKMNISGKVIDNDGKGIEGASVKLFKMGDFIKNPSKLKEVTTNVGYKNPKAMLDLDKLLETTPAAEVKSGSDGKYEFKDVTPDLFVIHGSKASYADDVLGMDFDTGEITADSAVQPPDPMKPTSISDQDLTLMGGPMKDPAPIEPDPAPEAPDIECTADDGCTDNKICVGGECKFECEADAACSDNLLCIDNRCAPCSDDAQCGTEGKFCSNGACIDSECEADGDCVEAGATKCDNHICVAECAEDTECTEEGLAKCDGGSCMAVCDVLTDGGCEAPMVCRPSGKGAICKLECEADTDCADDFICEENRCVAPPPPDPNVIHDPVDAGEWVSFKITTAEGDELADASNGKTSLDAASLGKGRVVRISGEISDTTLTEAFLRVQIGAYECGDMFPPKVDFIPLQLDGGKIVSELGEFQTLAIFPDIHQGFQLDVDEEPLNGNESFAVRNEDPDCSPPSNPFQALLTWEEANADLDLHVWWVTDDEEKHIYYSKSKRSVDGVGFLDVDDRNGYGPEVFTGAEGVTGGKFRIRANFFAGAEKAKGSVRVIIYTGGKLTDNTFSFSINKRDWVDIGEFEL